MWAQLVNPIIETCCVESSIFTVRIVSHSTRQFGEGDAAAIKSIHLKEGCE